MDEKRIQNVTWEPGSRRPLGRPRTEWQDNIKFYVKDVGMSNGIGSCCLSFDPMAGCFEHYVKGEAFIYCSSFKFSRKTVLRVKQLQLTHCSEREFGWI